MEIGQHELSEALGQALAEEDDIRLDKSVACLRGGNQAARRIPLRNEKKTINEKRKQSRGYSRSCWAGTHEGLVGRVETQFSNFGQGRLCPKFQ